MTKNLLSLAVVACAAPVLAGVYGDAPDLKHAWSVHDMNRPNPVKVTPASVVGLPPSDAIVLFDGTKESFDANWCDKDGNPTKWVYDPEEKSFGLKLQCKEGKWSTGAGPIYTRGKFGDCQYHLEFKYPADIKGSGQMRGNSGCFLMDMYEIQIMESYDTDPANNTNPNYADGQCGAVYAENPPMVNANRKPGEWQTYDIVFHQPVWNGDELVHPGSVTVFHNGILVQDHWEMEGLTTHCRRRPLAPHETARRFQFQDHGCPISFRNIWIRPLPSRWANTTHSVLSGKVEDVMALRAKTAERLYAKIADKDAVTTANFEALAEVITYSADCEYVAQFKKVSNAWLAKFEAMDDAALKNAKGDITSIRRVQNVLIRNKLIPETCKLHQKVKEVCKKFSWK